MKESRMLNPAHPGAVLREVYFEPLGISVTDFAEAIGVSRKTMSMILNERAGISAEMAIRLSQALITAPTFWLGMQANHDLAQAKKLGISIDPIAEPRDIPEYPAERESFKAVP